MNIIELINNTQINPLAINYPDLTTNQIGKLDKTKPVILVDTSYWLYYRYFALRNWYIKAFPDITKEANFNMEHNWLEDEIFMNKYRKLFIENIKVLTRKYKTIMQNVVFCLDCSYKEIWRNVHTNEYKATRPESLKKKQFNSFNVFSYIKKDYLPYLQLKYGIKILYNSKCEADDVIGNFAPFLIENKFPLVYIIANDNDYLQICNEKIIMLRGNIQPNNQAQPTGDETNNEKATGDKYLIKKILIGDVSDNIKACAIDINSSGTFKNIHKSYISNLIDNPDKYTIFQNLLIKIRNGSITNANDDELKFIRNFYENTVLMDFKMIPSNLKNELIKKIQNFL
jgi:5'-3' exonuclease